MNVSATQGMQTSNMQAVEKYESQTKSNDNTSKSPSDKHKAVEDIEKIYQEAISYKDFRDYENSIKSLVRIIRIDKYNPEAQYMLGYIYEFHVTNSLQKALKWYIAAHANGSLEAKIALVRLKEIKPESGATIAAG